MALSLLYGPALTHWYMITGKTLALIRWTFAGKVMSLLFNHSFFSKEKCLLISWLQSPSVVILEPKKIKSVTISTFSSSVCHEVIGLDAMILVLWMLSFKLAFYSPLLSSSRGSSDLLHFLPLEWYLIAVSPGNLDFSL